MFALIVTFVVFPLAALGVDLGNAYARITDTQTQADYGALAAARLQTESAKAGMTIPTAMVDAVRDAMNTNQPQDDKSKCWTTKTCITSAQLTDGNLTNGEVRFCAGATCGTGYATTTKGIQVLAPYNKVDYGFANMLGVGSGTVDADALVNVFTAGKRVMPMYAVTGCDYGLQTLADPAGGFATPAPPTTLAFPSDSNGSTLTYSQTSTPPSPQLKDSSGTVVTSLVLNSTNNTVTFSASKFRNVSKIGFFREDGSAPVEVTEFRVGTSPGPPYQTVPWDPNAAGTITVAVPNSVAAIGEVWWIRVYSSANPGANQWSDRTQALPIRVGNAVLQCASGSTAGNFGTLKFPRTDVATANQIPANIALGLQPPLSPVVHQTPATNGLCSDGVNGAKTAPSGGVTLVVGVNCVDTDTGLAANVATEGLVTGSTYGTGVLRTKNTRAGCDPTGGSADRTLPITGNPSINDDVLTCYFTDGTTSIQTIAQAGYNGGPVLDPAILSSPRFFYVPVLKVQPGSGGSNRYSIIDFRPAFITDETASTASVKGAHTGTSDNGLTVQGNDIKQIKVVFFSLNALPSEGDIPLIDYLGVGSRVIRLID
jgi:hypothetical protein